MESKTRTRQISSDILFPLIEEELAKGKKARFTVSGVSMTPWIIHNRDSVELISAEGLSLKKGDIILFQPFPGTYVLHRITKVLPQGYITTGDGNVWRDAPISRECVIGKVTTIYRKKKRIICDAWHWKLLAGIWMALYPVRKQAFACISHIQKMT